MTAFAHISSGSFQGWRTPKHIFDPLMEEFKFVKDCAADKDNTLCPDFFSEEDDAISQIWDFDGMAWTNPPYRDPKVWIMKALYEVNEAKRCPGVVFLLPASTSTKWFRIAATKAEVQLYEGRIAFDKPPEMTNARRPGAGSALVIVRPEGLIGVTAFRSHKTGLITQDLT